MCYSDGYLTAYRVLDVEGDPWCRRAHVHTDIWEICIHISDSGTEANIVRISFLFDFVSKHMAFNQPTLVKARPVISTIHFKSLLSIC